MDVTEHIQKLINVYILLVHCVCVLVF